MNEYEPHEPSSRGTAAALVWLGVVVLFLGCLTWIITSAGPSAQWSAVKAAPVAAGNDPGAIVDGLQEKTETAGTIPPFDASQAYVLVGSGTQGMYQQTAADGTWTLSNAAPELAAQVVKRGPPAPQLQTKGITVTWELEQTAGLTDNKAPCQGTMEPVEDSYFRASVPVNAIRADGAIDPYPVVTLRAKDDATGEVLAESAVVLAVSPGFGCAHCHENGGKAILETHDRHQSTTLLEQSAKGEVISCRSCHAGPPEPPAEGSSGAAPETPSGTPPGTLTDASTDAQAAAPSAATTGGSPKQGDYTPLGFSAAIHGWHAAYLPDRGADACMSCHISLGRVGPERAGPERGESESAGDVSQAPPKAMFARDVHVERGLSCVNCHGFMEDHTLALLKAEQEAGRTQAAKPMAVIQPRTAQLDAITPRRAWTQEPDCASCHDFSVKPDLKTASSFNAWTDKSMGASALFGNNKDDMMMLRCITCHGAPHAIYKAENPSAKDLDNMPPLQYQKLAAPLGDYGNCAVCHGEPKDFSAHHPLVPRDEPPAETP